MKKAWITTTARWLCVVRDLKPMRSYTSLWCVLHRWQFPRGSLNYEFVCLKVITSIFTGPNLDLNLEFQSFFIYCCHNTVHCTSTCWTEPIIGISHSTVDKNNCSGSLIRFVSSRLSFAKINTSRCDQAISLLAKCQSVLVSVTWTSTINFMFWWQWFSWTWNCALIAPV